MTLIALTQTVQRALRASPVPLRALARAAGVSHTLLQMVLAGYRGATPEVARRLATALELVERKAGEHAWEIREALKKLPPTGSLPRRKPQRGSGSA